MDSESDKLDLSDGDKSDIDNSDVEKSDNDKSDLHKQDSPDADVSSTGSDSTSELVKILRPKDLNKHRNLRTCLPHYGPKFAEPDDSSCQDAQLSKMRAHQNELLKEERVAKLGNLSMGNWHPGKQLIELVTVKGKFWQTMGYSMRGKKYLYPEEGIFLLEMGVLELYGNNLPLSLQQSYNLLIPSQVSLDEYQVYAHLVRLGYIVTRHRHNDITEYEHRIKMYHHRSIQQKLACKKVQGWMDQIGTPNDQPQSMMDCAETTGIKRASPFTDSDSSWHRKQQHQRKKRLKFSCEKVKGWMRQMMPENIQNPDVSELTDESCYSQSSGNAFSFKSAGDFNRNISSHKQKKKVIKEKKGKMEIQTEVGSKGSANSLECEENGTTDDDESSYYSDGPVKPLDNEDDSEGFVSVVNLLDFYAREVCKKEPMDCGTSQSVCSVANSNSSGELFRPSKLPKETRTPGSDLSHKVPRMEDSATIADVKDVFLLPSSDSIPLGKAILTPVLGRVESLIECVEGSKSEHQKVQKLIDNRKRLLKESSCNLVKDTKLAGIDPSVTDLTKTLSDPKELNLQSSDLGTSELSTSSLSFDIDEFLDTLVDQMKDGKKRPTRKQSNRRRPYSDWDFSQTTIPNISSSQLNSSRRDVAPEMDSTRWTLSIPKPKERFFPIEGKRAAEGNITSEKKLTEKKVENLGSEKRVSSSSEEKSPTNWREYKKMQEVRPTKSLKDVMKSPVGHLWKDGLKPLLRPVEALTTGEIFKKLNVISSLGTSSTYLGSMDCPSSFKQLRITFDAYHPDANFKKTSPGRAAFSMIIRSINEPLPNLAAQMHLLRQSRPVPLLFAIVDNADISFYSVKDVNMPLDIGVD